jgi:plasmid maintenance system killer protein
MQLGETCKKEYGQKTAKLLRRRLDDLAAAVNLFEVYRLPGKCHALKRDREGCYAMALDGGYRLLFRCAVEPPPLNNDNSIDPLRVTAIKIVSVEDYHE